MDYLEEDIREVKQKLAEQERTLNEKMDTNHRDLKMLLRETEIENKEQTNKMFSALEKVSDAIHSQTIATNNVAHKTEENTKSIDKMEKSTKTKDRTIAGFVISIILMILGTFWGMWFPG
ncbi:hypothetical protein [Salinicoccus roseus]|uniref:Uncharacterized protein n=1 Tax=Salinicoccus roseus TaxID=45670 RepID=A0A265E688_9STAP|nr:hypothetical protein [Salinicoccus roseus]OZT77102.1 hypothetical protein CFN03_08480 [Salinicoccus roseus]